MVMCRHASRFQRRNTCFIFERRNFGFKGAGFKEKSTKYHQVKCTEQCPMIERDVSILLLLFYVFFPNSFKSTCSGKTRWHTFSGFGPASLSYRANAASYPFNPGSKPVIIFLETSIQLERLHCKIWKRNQLIILAKFVIEIPISFNSKYCLLDLFKRKKESGGTHLPQ